MSYKTNPTINRVKHTIGWRLSVKSTLPNKYRIIENALNHKTFIFLKNWFKLRNWVLLNVEQNSSKKTKLWFITAMRIPKRNKKYNRGILHFYDEKSIAANAKVFMQYKKRISYIKKHFKHRKKTFKFLNVYKNARNFQKYNKSLKNDKMQKIFGLYKPKINLISTKKWLRLLSNMQQISFLNAKQNCHDFKEKSQSVNILHFSKSLNRTFFWPTRKWAKYKKIEKMPKKKDFIYNKFFFFKTNNKKSTSTLCLTEPKIVQNIKHFVNKRRELSFLRLRTRWLKIKWFLNLKKNNKKSLKNKSKIDFMKNFFKLFKTQKQQQRKKLFNIWKKIRLAKEKRVACYKRHVFTKHKLKYLKYIKFFYKKRLRKFNKKKSDNTTAFVYWKNFYIKKLLTKENNIQKFLKLFKKIKATKKLLKPKYKIFFFKKKIKKLSLYKKNNFTKIDKKISWLFDRNMNNKKKRFYTHINRLAQRQTKRLKTKVWKPYKTFVFNDHVKFKMSWASFNWDLSKRWKKKKALLFYKKKQEQQYLTTQKIKLNSFRLNFLFKKIVNEFFKRPINDGSFIIKFLQPTGSLLSMRKLRSLSSRISVIKRYKRQKLYRRMLRIMLLFFRYIHPQPLVEQIAFELEKTKKHWPILKTIRTLMQKIIALQFQGYRIMIRGKINSADRTRSFIIKYGHDVPISTFNSRVLFGVWKAWARTGSFGVRGWIYLPQKSKKKNERK